MTFLSARRLALAGVEYGHAYQGIAVVTEDDVVVGKAAVGGGGKDFRPLSDARGDR